MVAVVRRTVGWGGGKKERIKDKKEKKKKKKKPACALMDRRREYRCIYVHTYIYTFCFDWYTVAPSLVSARKLHGFSRV